MFASALYIFVTDVCVYMQVLNGLSLWRLYQHVNGTSAKHAWAWKMKILKKTRVPGETAGTRTHQLRLQGLSVVIDSSSWYQCTDGRSTLPDIVFADRGNTPDVFVQSFFVVCFLYPYRRLWTTLPPQVKNQSALFYHHHHHHHNNNDDDYYYYCCCCFNFFFVGHRRNCFDHFNALGHSSRRRVTRRLLRGHLKNPSEPNVWWILPWILSNIECGFVQKCKSQCNSNIKMKLWKHLFVHEAVSALFLRCQT